MTFDWEQYKQEIAGLYLESRMTLVKIQKELARKHPNFKPSISSYRTKLRKWGLLRRDAVDKKTRQKKPGASSPGRQGRQGKPNGSVTQVVTTSPPVPGLIYPTTPSSNTHQDSTPRFPSSPSTPQSTPVVTDSTPFAGLTYGLPGRLVESKATPSLIQTAQLHSSSASGSSELDFLGQIVDSHGNTRLHRLAMDGPTFQFLEANMRNTKAIDAVNRIGQTFLHVLNPGRMQCMDTVERFLNLCEKLGYNFAHKLHVIPGLKAAQSLWPQFNIELTPNTNDDTYRFMLSRKVSSEGSRSLPGTEEDGETSTSVPKFLTTSLDFSLYDDENVVYDHAF